MADTYTTASPIANVITKSISEQKKYNDIIIDEKIATAISRLQLANTLQLPTVDSGLPNAIWIDTTS